MVVMMSCPPVFCAEPSDPDLNINVSADRMVAWRDDSAAEFTGNVIVTRMDTTIRADSIKIFFTGDPTDGSETAPETASRINKIIATGHVEYVDPDRKAFADKAVYLAEDETLTLTGSSPKVTSGTSFVSGERIIVYQKTGRVTVEGNVQALFNPKDSPNQ